LIKKVRCPDCRERFEIDYSEYDEGDVMNCPECNLELNVVYVGDKPKLKSSKDLYFENDDEFDEDHDE